MRTLRWKPCKVWKHNSCGWQYIFSGIFGSVPGERYRFWPAPGARNCFNLHLFIDIIHDCCNHMTPLVHLKQLNTNILIHNCNTALKHKNVKTTADLLPISFGTILENSRRYLLKHRIFHVEINGSIFLPSLVR